jgi:hypothetical protein
MNDSLMMAYYKAENFAKLIVNKACFLTDLRWRFSFDFVQKAQRDGTY